VAYAGSRVRDGENRKRFISFKFTHDFDYPETLLYKFTKGDWSEVEIDSNGNRTENRSTTKHTGIQKEHVGRWRKNWLPFKQNYLPQVLSLMNLKFLSLTELENMGVTSHDYDDSEERYPVMYLQDAQNLFNEDAEYGNWKLTKAGGNVSIKLEKLS
jgi:hypothetical protein